MTLRLARDLTLFGSLFLFSVAAGCSSASDASAPPGSANGGTGATPSGGTGASSGTSGTTGTSGSTGIATTGTTPSTGSSGGTGGTPTTAKGGAGGGGATSVPTGGTGAKPAGGAGGTTGSTGEAGKCKKNSMITIEAKSNDSGTQGSELKFWMMVTFLDEVLLTDYSIRYWFTKDAATTVTHPFKQIQGQGLTGLTSTDSIGVDPASGSDYVEIALGGIKETYIGIQIEAQGSLVADNYQGKFNKLNDWSYDPDATATSFTAWDHITVYQKGTLVAGCEPPAGGGTVTPATGAGGATAAGGAASAGTSPAAGGATAAGGASAGH